MNIQVSMLVLCLHDKILYTRSIRIRAVDAVLTNGEEVLE